MFQVGKLGYRTDHNHSISASGFGFYLGKGVALDIPVEVATITALLAVVVGSSRPKAHGQQKTLTVAT